MTNEASKKYKNPHVASTAKTHSMPTDATHNGNIDAIAADTAWLSIIAIAIPLARILVGMSSVSTSHTQTPGPKA